MTALNTLKLAALNALELTALNALEPPMLSDRLLQTAVVVDICRYIDDSHMTCWRQTTVIKPVSELLPIFGRRPNARDARVDIMVKKCS
jgi:hypothetical protein